MKKTILAFILLFIVSTSFVYRDSDYGYNAIYMAREDLENSVKYLTDGRELVNPGKIYYKAPYIYINERYKGVHVINNTKPTNPVNEGFITAPGCIDMAVKGDVLYLDNSVDLVAFNLSSKTVTKRIKDIFPEPTAPNNQYYHDNDRPSGFVLVGWKKNTSHKSK